jgi:hypothetical protein
MDKFGARGTTDIISLTRAAPVKLFGLMPRKAFERRPRGSASISLGGLLIDVNMVLFDAGPMSG